MLNISSIQPGLSQVCARGEHLTHGASHEHKRIRSELGNGFRAADLNASHRVDRVQKLVHEILTKTPRSELSFTSTSPESNLCAQRQSLTHSQLRELIQARLRQPAELEEYQLNSCKPSAHQQTEVQKRPTKC